MNGWLEELGTEASPSDWLWLRAWQKDNIHFIEVQLDINIQIMFVFYLDKTMACFYTCSLTYTLKIMFQTQTATNVLTYLI